ncbi:MAG: Peptide deformylase [Candidatus Uhrbacteria bacterium GW2011_GWE2_40_58]|nr:MAG: Peptide deformylase [Candidatus Uhrbacteria bacterium GW2011_GWF2_40_263]KKR68084.1 MAG: Peptide deformylase [Candidatus Uhrbacteria bacterium GW2011_GWE2_40_58]OGL91785.1 MAG: peptide deformylase [Candidatus Uhrbacteria bacterium RIFOXYA2_FULL_40_9]OGL97235.1 MAG: peptide deformylase [Candidatus Uhrbacteria bacterium RIFOXYB2_FULL_41_18]HBK34458.1 peptide deformylase [Candidatus Uhrbacteria bacterium]
MTTYPVITIPNPDLRVLSEEIDPRTILEESFQTLIEDMKETMVVSKGVGLAAPQIDLPKRLIIVKIREELQAFINPEIISRSLKTVVGEEGCLSVPGVYGLVKRHQRVTVKAYNQQGEKIKMRVDGFSAIIFQHEIDHLNGILFTDKVIEYTKRTG